MHGTHTLAMQHSHVGKAPHRTLDTREGHTTNTKWAQRSTTRTRRYDAKRPTSNLLVFRPSMCPRFKDRLTSHNITTWFLYFRTYWHDTQHVNKIHQQVYVTGGLGWSGMFMAVRCSISVAYKRRTHLCSLLSLRGPLLKAALFGQP